jgi:hypothetical protein
MNARETAAYVKRGRGVVLREIRAGRLKAARIGGRGEILTRREWCDEWIERQTTPVLVAPRRRA